MRLRPLLAAFCLLLTISVATVSPALAQDEPGAGLTDLDKALGEGSGADTPLTTSPSDDSPIPDIVSPTSPVAPPADAAPAPAAGSVVPVPPAYLVPGQSAAVQPVSGVESRTEPDVPLEPVRLAALIAVLLATLLLGGATLLRSLGVRTSIGQPVIVAPPGRFVRVRDRSSSLADDIRDFLRHNR